MRKALSRIAERERSARFLNSLGAEELWAKFGISRVADISGFDVTGIPIWTSTRPLSLSISINSGKGLNTMMARAGAIAEGIEFYFAETAQPIQRQKTISQMHRWRDFDIVPANKWHLAKGAVITDLSVFDWDVVAPIQNLDALKFLLPSGAIYLAESDVAHLIRFQSSTNGWATGATRDDAVLQGLYEVVERDSWTLWHYLAEKHGVWPRRLDLPDFDDPWITETLARLDEQSLKPVCFDIATDTTLATVWTVLYDLSDRPAGIFSGFGTAWTWQQALRRSLLEACQSRACYIAGARDDLFRRSFLLLKGVDQSQGYVQAMSLPNGVTFDCDIELPGGIKEELAQALQQLSNAGFDDFYVRDCGMPFANNPFNVVKVYASCLEQWRCAYWSPSSRLFNFVNKYVKT
jgi:YcaO-like protein with predicted kinase domain